VRVELKPRMILVCLFFDKQDHIVNKTGSDQLFAVQAGLLGYKIN
jgi:hypothetical protein